MVYLISVPPTQPSKSLLHINDDKGGRSAEKV